MHSKKRGLFIASILAVVAILLSSCEQPYSTPPAVTNTPINSNSLFTTPMTTTTPGSMSDLEVIASQTALALTGTSNPSIFTATPNGTAGTATLALLATQTPTPMIGLGPTATATQAVSGGATSAVATSTSVPVGSRPSSYVLREGEFPFCIARRFNLDPDQLLAVNGLSAVEAESLSTGTTLIIPQSGTFPGDRARHPHPATFIVGTTYPTNTVHGVACYFGDVDPSVIAQANGISVDARLTNGQTLNIP